MIDKLSAALPSGIPFRVIQNGADDRIDLVAAIQQVLRAIELIRDGHLVASGRADLDLWEGDAYVYLEADLKDSADQDIDINVHDGRVFIRIASDESPDGPALE